MAEPRGPFNSPGFWLHHAALAWRHELDLRLAELALTHTQFNLLASTSWLDRDAAVVTQQDVADFAGADRMMASKVLSSLEQRHLIARRPHPTDSRAKRLEVTSTGRALVRQAAHIVAEIDETMFGPDSDQRRHLRAQLEHLARTRHAVT